MKRVYTLYRVSTTRQVDVVKDDIPMQRIACREFAGRFSDWEIIKEFEEKGISGYKVSATKRDAIIDLREAAERKEFDVLLIFMFDRLGRKEDETPLFSSGLLNMESKCGAPMKVSRKSNLPVIS